MLLGAVSCIQGSPDPSLSQCLAPSVPWGPKDCDCVGSSCASVIHPAPCPQMLPLAMSFPVVRAVITQALRLGWPAGSGRGTCQRQPYPWPGLWLDILHTLAAFRFILTFVASLVQKPRCVRFSCFSEDTQAGQGTAALGHGLSGARPRGPSQCLCDGHHRMALCDSPVTDPQPESTSGPGCAGRREEAGKVALRHSAGRTLPLETA